MCTDKTFFLVGYAAVALLWDCFQPAWRIYMTMQQVLLCLIALK